MDRLRRHLEDQGFNADSYDFNESRMRSPLHPTTWSPPASGPRTSSPLYEPDSSRSHLESPPPLIPGPSTSPLMDNTDAASTASVKMVHEMIFLDHQPKKLDVTPKKVKRLIKEARKDNVRPILHRLILPEEEMKLPKPAGPSRPKPRVPASPSSSMSSTSLQRDCEEEVKRRLGICIRSQVNAHINRFLREAHAILNE